ncbi:DNA-directed DNA polymerase [Powellomyces hirtus]|uniref:DNA-directed DNA polymerase n=1 Tax=Powellomyces hirtus TaxID=109895 RepID=A0A507DLK8_9FUNG|nr:DNA-directed DNA polymerase [Powellomyces hirtus]
MSRCLLAEAADLLAEATEPGEDKPAFLKAALKASDARQWAQAAQTELNSLHANHTWDLVPLPAGCQPIKCKWVFKIKRAADGSLQHYKPRLVAQGFSQREGVDYAIEDMELEQMDAVTAFLNPNIEEEIYMEQPEGFAIVGQGHLLCRLRRSLHGLKQSSCHWNQILDARLKQLGFVQSNADNCIHSQHAQDPKSTLYRLVYVDDMILASKSMKHYLQKFLASFGMDNCKPVSTPMETSTRLTKAMEPQSNEERAQMASRHTLLECCTLDAVLELGGSLSTVPDLEGYSDSNWAGCPDSTSSTTGFVFRFGGTVATCKEAIWLMQLLIELGYPQDLPCKIYEDNQGCIVPARKPTSHAKTKHIYIRHHCIR